MSIAKNHISRCRGVLYSSPKKLKISLSVRQVGMGLTQITPFYILGVAPLSDSCRPTFMVWSLNIRLKLLLPVKCRMA